MKVMDRQVRAPVMWAVLAILLALALVAVFFAVNSSGANTQHQTPPPGTSSPFADQGSPVAMAELLSATTTSAAFSDQATVATAAQLADASLSAGSCPGTYWTWTGHFTYSEYLLFNWGKFATWYSFGPTNYWCSNKAGTKVLSYGWVNKRKDFGGVYTLIGTSGWHLKCSNVTGPLPVYDTWTYRWSPCCGLSDTRKPSLDYTLYAYGGVVGRVYYDH